MTDAADGALSHRDDGGLVQGRRPSTRNLVPRLVGVLRSSEPEHQAARQAIGIFGLRGASAGIAYLSQVFLARWMGGTEYGIFVSVWSWLLILAIVASLGLSVSVQRFVQRARSGEDDAALRGALFGTRALGLGLATAIMALGLGLVWLLGARMAEPYVMTTVLLLICLPMIVLADIQDGIARTFEWMGLAMVPPYIGRPLVLLACVGVLTVIGVPATAPLVAIAAIVGVWSMGLLQWLLLRRRLRENIAAGPRTLRFGVWVRVSVPVLLSDSFSFLLLNADILVLTMMRPAEDVAIYFAATRTISLVLFIAFAVTAASAHRFADAYARHDTRLLGALLTRSVAWTLFPSLLAAAAMLAIGPWALWLFGEAFTVGYVPMCVLAVGFLVRASVGASERLLNMVGEERACALVYVAALVVNLALNVALIPHYGLVGAAIATVAALVVESAGLAWLIRRRLGLSILSGWNPMAVLRPVA